MLVDSLQLLAEMRATGRPSGADVRWTAQARAFRETAGQPMTLRRAAAFAAMLDAMQPRLYEHDFLVGSLASPFCGTQETSAEDQALLRQIGKREFITHTDHVIIDFPRLLRLGLGGIRAEIAARLLASEELSPAQREFLRSMEVTVAAAARYLGRYGEACAARAAESTGEAREYWRGLADRCTRLADAPPASFADALQLIWFVHHLLSQEGDYANGFGRLDQYLYPFYAADRASGVLTDAEALALLKHLWVKLGERHAVWGCDDVANIAIGGLTADGEDGTNPLSYLCLAATRAVQIPGPNLSARFHPDTPRRFYLECIQTFATGVGYPALFNDQVLIPAVMSLGIPERVARDYALVGCIETFLPGQQPPWADGRFNTPKYVELTLGNGRDLRTGEQLGPETGDPCRFKSFEEFQDALRRQIEAGMRKYAEHYRALNRALDPSEYTKPFLSALMTDCVARARDVNDGGVRYPSNHGIGGMGLGTATDSLAAVRKGVFEERRFTMETLLEALRADFKGYETLQAWLWQRAPKYGNDDPEADTLAVWIAETFSRAALAERTYDGGRYLPLIAANVQNVLGGQETAATPDGRYAGTPLSDAGSPTYGRDILGPTAVINSVTKVNWRHVVGGSVINQKYHPGALETEEGREKLAALLHAFFIQGGQEMQFNVIDAEKLREAMAHPEEYQDLVVRVSGFSARFVTLEPAVQRDILARTTHKAL